MKRNRTRTILTMMLLIITLLLLPVVAYAAPMEPADVMVRPDSTMEFFTLEWIGTAAGIVAAVALMVQVCKFIVPVQIDPKIYCLIWSFIFTMARLLWVAPPTSAADYFSGAINMLLIAVAATGTFEYAIKPVQKLIMQNREAKQQLEGTTDEQGGDGNE